MKNMNFILHFAIILFLAANVNAQLPEFTAIDTGGIYDPGQSAVHVSAIVADIDNDGDLDPVISNNGMPSVYKPLLTLYTNDRQGRYKQTSNAFPVRVTSPFGDIDNDGDIDIIGNPTYDNSSLRVFTNGGYGNFTSGTTLSLPYALDGSIYPVLFDYNKDGFLDLVQFDTCVTILPNNGNGQFLDPEYFLYDEKIPTDFYFHGMSWGDVDNDGDMDYYLGVSGSGINKNVFFINTDSGLQKMNENHITLSDTAATPCVNWIDYDNDGDLDLFVDNVALHTATSGYWSLYKNLGNLEFEKHIFDDKNFSGSHSNSSVWGDIDNDGDLDLFISVENNSFPMVGANYGHVSTYPYNVLYLNNGDGQFTNIFDHTLTTTDSHTAKLFDHDNDGDLDVLMVRYSWAVGGHNQLYINEGNNNTSVSINCTDKYGCATPFGTRIYAKTKINSTDVSQMREITPVNGHLSYGNTRVHFGLGDAEQIDTLIIRWPSGHVDNYLNVPVTHFYEAIEDSALNIDFKATSYIELSQGFTNLETVHRDESKIIDLKPYYKLITGDTVPEILSDTLNFILHSKGNPNVIDTELNGSLLTVTGTTRRGSSTIQIIASAGFTKRMDPITLKGDGMSTDIVESKESFESILIYPNPASDKIYIKTALIEKCSIEITTVNGQMKYNTTMEDSEIEIDISTLKSGIYFITVRTNDDVKTLKFIKQ